MADKRINALANTASSTASDDFIAVDGTTNGTRKLNAFSPTFGGNATVTGTLTVNGVATAGSYLTSAAGLTFPGALSANGYYLYSGSANGLTMYGYGSTYDVYIGNRAGTRALSVAANSTVVSIPDTTASTTTSTGALVVGNGTSGGLGVGGAINAGGNVTISGSNGYAVIGGRQWSFRANSSGGSPASGCVIRDDSAAADRLTIDINGNTSVLSTTASTSTSSGALVVSGGVGVGGKVTSTAVAVANTSQSIAAWGDIGPQLSVAGAVITDTSSSGTVGRIVTNSIASSALAASSTTTYTAAASLFIAGAPTANTNVTITNAYAIYTAAGRINFQGLPTSSAGLQAGTLWNDSGTLKVA